MKNNYKCDLSFHDMVRINENGELIKVSPFKKKYQDISFFSISILWNFLFSTQMMFRVKFIDELLPMPLWFWMYQDHWTVLVLSMLNCDIEFIDKCLVYYRRWHSSLSKFTNQCTEKERVMVKIRYLDEIQNKYPDKDLSYQILYLNDLIAKKLDWKQCLIKFWIFIFFRYNKIFILIFKSLLHENFLNKI